MSRAENGRFKKGQSGNPKGRPKARRPHVSAFDIIFDKSLSVTQNGVERELTVDEALEWQTYQAALGGSRMAIRKVLKMIEGREAALARKAPQVLHKIRTEAHHTSDNANEALRILNIARPDPGMEGKRWFLEAWATQAALSRPGRRKFEKKEIEGTKFFTADSDTLRWPKRTGQ
ncbi:hypothetical protein K3181_03120 [Qipengyuania sp. YG27]|uniref:DUF5681 domain-containing protein n=1 Tax=Qipengyuania mesophila TaxID=2867246 RepID=A0ABS7JS09_9SPHN|nr:DUF5681 domain-containing protein [Qipengyuania mesophila]MBX7500437.1 hypothetical protein [Qipengyuania mesophila]